MIEPYEVADLAALLSLQPVDGALRSWENEANLHGRVYGGQLVGQCLAAAAACVEEAHRPTTLQVAFLRGPDPVQPIDYSVARLQDGGSFSTRRVTASQRGAPVAEAHATFARADAASTMGVDADPRPVLEPGPNQLPDADRFPPAVHDRLRRGGYATRPTSRSIDCRFVDPAGEMLEPSPDAPLRYWLRSAQSLPDQQRVHDAAFGYLSDWWLNFVAVARLLAAPASTVYSASLNHTIWFHAPPRADDWLLVVARSRWIGADRGLSAAEVFDRRGQLVATVAQEARQAPRRDPR